MMTFKRKIYDEIVKWNSAIVKNSSLLIEGARRIGKTTIVKEFANNYYKDNYIYIDFKVASDDLKNIFNNVAKLDVLFEKLFLFSGQYARQGGLVIFDEIQYCPKAREAIKYLVADGRFSYIETGSLISIKENVQNIQIPSEERRIEMYPMDFEEFLWATNDHYSATYIKEKIQNKSLIDESIHKELLNKFRRYLAIGGMPKVLDIFLETHSYLEADLEKKDILSLYKDDLRKHDLKYGTSCEMLFDSIPYQLAKESTRFFVSNLDNKRIEDFERSLFDLSDYKLVNIVNNFRNPDSFFELTKEKGLFKMYCVDTGLLVTSLLKGQFDDINSIYQKLINDEFNYDFGAIFESIVCQMLVCRGIKTYYHTFSMKNESNEDKKYEIDFMYQTNFNNFAFEVKSTKRFTTKSLEVLKAKYSQLKFKRYVISIKNYNPNEEIPNIPIYMVGFLK